jgi:hypothetical protein
MKPEQLEIERLRREVAKLKAERDIQKKGRGLVREGSDMRFAFIANHRSIWPVAWLCEALDVSSAAVQIKVTVPAWVADACTFGALSMTMAESSRA